MNYLKIITRNLIFFRKNNLLFLISIIVISSVIIGSLVTGDSVRASLERTAVNNLGKTDYILTSGNRYLNDSISKNLAANFNIKTASILSLKGACIKDGGKYKLNNINIIGIDEKYSNFNNTGMSLNLNDNEIYVNTKLAKKINLKENDELVIRIKKINLIPEEAPLARTSSDFVSLNLVVKKILDADNLGNFNIHISQIPQANVFLSKKLLNKKLGFSNLCNLILISAGNSKDNINDDMLNTKLKDLIRLEDIGLKLRALKITNQIELVSDRIFMDGNIEKLFNDKYTKIMTYFVNDIIFMDKTTPYSFITSRSDVQLNEDDIIINKWLSEDLNAGINDFIKLKYFTLGSKNEFIEKNKTFKIIKIIENNDKLIDRYMMPEYPGFSSISNCRNWNPDIKIDLSKIRKNDEKYWNEFKGTPKAIISFKTASRIWDNRFGNITSIRFDENYYNEKKIREEIEGRINPQNFNIKFISIKKQAINAAHDSIDFGQLFIGLNLFIIISLLILIMMINGYNLEKRRNQIGIFASLGFKFMPIFFIYFSEILILVFIGFLTGILFAILYVKLILFALSTIWNNALLTSNLYIYINPITLTSSFFFLMLLIIPPLINQIFTYQKNPVKSIRNIEVIKKHKKVNKNNTFSMIFMIIIFCLSVIFFILIFVMEEYRIILFFISSFLILISLLLIFGMFIKLYRNFNNTYISIAFRNISKNKIRSLSIVGLIAAGLFILFITGINTKSLEYSTDNKKSGTGGFDFYAELTNPVIKDINRMKLEKDDEDIYNMDFVQIRLKQYDDASCLNMNHITNPSVIGINPEDFDKRNSFNIIQILPGFNQKRWSILNYKYDDNIIPAFIDNDVLKWGLNKKLGDIIDYIDDSGNILKIKLTGIIENSIFQGKIIISEENFIKYFPSINGYNIFLVDKIKSNIKEAEDIIAEKFRNYGIEIKKTDSLLNEFNMVENTYISIFFILGCFGLILGTLGIGMVIIKNIYEDKNQIAILMALGFEKNKIFLIYIIQHIFLFLAGIFIGLFSSLIVIIPMLILYGLKINILSMLAVVLLILITGFVSIFITANRSFNQKIIMALKND